MSKMLQFETRLAFALGRTPIRIENNVQQLTLQSCVQDVRSVLKVTARSFEMVVPAHKKPRIFLKLQIIGTVRPALSSRTGSARDMWAPHTGYKSGAPSNRHSLNSST